jgi:hypothetical protein
MGPMENHHRLLHQPRLQLNRVSCKHASTKLISLWGLPLTLHRKMVMCVGFSYTCTKLSWIVKQTAAAAADTVAKGRDKNWRDSPRHIGSHASGTNTTHTCPRKTKNTWVPLESRGAIKIMRSYGGAYYKRDNVRHRVNKKTPLQAF